MKSAIELRRFHNLAFVVWAPNENSFWFSFRSKWYTKCKHLISITCLFGISLSYSICIFRYRESIDHKHSRLLNHIWAMDPPLIPLNSNSGRRSSLHLTNCGMIQMEFDIKQRPKWQENIKKKLSTMTRT